MPNVTIAFDEAVKGWTSEFTFLPDAGLSLNNNFYTFHRGRIWKHNSQTADRNTFYGVTSDTEITFVFNENPTIVKNFKNLGFGREWSYFRRRRWRDNLTLGGMQQSKQTLKMGLLMLLTLLKKKVRTTDGLEVSRLTSDLTLSHPT